MSNFEQLPDITSVYRADTPSSLQWVGMEGVAIPLLFGSADTNPAMVNVMADLYVSLSNSAAKGIHMSRLFLKLNQMANKKLEKEGVDELLKNMIESQGGISQNAKVNFKFELTLEKSSLSSNEAGYQAYPDDFEVGSESITVININCNLPFLTPAPARARRLLLVNYIKMP